MEYKVDNGELSYPILRLAVKIGHNWDSTTVSDGSETASEW